MTTFIFAAIVLVALVGGGILAIMQAVNASSAMH
jgi:hypothetical protein